MKISVRQLRRIIREEVEQEKVRRIVREAVKSDLNEGMWDDIKNLGSAVFTGKIAGFTVPKGVSNSDWVSILKQFGGKAPDVNDDAGWAYIDAMTQRSRKKEDILTLKSWKKQVEDQANDEAETRAADRARAQFEKDMQKLKDQNLERAASEERYNKKAAKRDAEMKQDEENREYREKSKKSQRQFAQALAGAMYNPGGSSGGGRVSDSW